MYVSIVSSDVITYQLLLYQALGEVILATRDIHAISDFASGRPNNIVKAISK